MTGFAAFIGRIKDRPGFGSVAGFDGRIQPAHCLVVLF